MTDGQMDKRKSPLSRLTTVDTDWIFKGTAQGVFKQPFGFGWTLDFLSSSWRC